MLGNEIDDSAPPRCLVHSSTVVNTVWKIGAGWRALVGEPIIDRDLLPREVDIALMNELSDRGLRMLLFGYEGDPVHPQRVLEVLDVYSHPFQSWLVFPTLGSLTHYLAMQNDVRFVVDRIHPAAYGSRGLQI